MTAQPRADLVRIDDQVWRLISQDGTCRTIVNPPLSWLNEHQPRRSSRDRQGNPPTVALTSQMTVILVGGGLLAAEIALSLAAGGIQILVSAPEAPTAAIDPLGHHTTAAAALQAWVRDRLPAAGIGSAPHWTAMTPEFADLVIVATRTVQPDRAITDHLARQHLPYLVVRAQHDTATVGPLVDHEGGPCLACVDLAVADHDQWWPITLAALTVTQAFPDAITARWAGAQAALEAAWFLTGAGTTLRGSTVEINATDAGVGRRRWDTHEDCSCCRSLDDWADLAAAA